MNKKHHLHKSDEFSFSSFLREKLDEKMLKNKRYSLRAFARDLQLSPSHLSEIMNGSAKPSRDLIRKLCTTIGIDRDEVEWICDAHDLKHAKMEWRRKSAASRLKNRNGDDAIYHYSEDQSRCIAGIIHPTILSYLELSKPPSSPQELAERLGENEDEVLSALARLERVGAIEYLEDQSIRVTRTRTRINDGVSPDAILNFHKQFSDFILEAIAHQPRPQRHSDGIVYAIPKEAVEEFKTILAETRRQLTEVSKKYEHKDSVYYVNLQMVEGKRTWD